MKPINIFLLLGITLVIISCTQPNGEKTTENPASPNREFYQLKIYTFDSEEQIQVTNNYLSEAYLPGLKKLGINNIGVFKQSSSLSTDSDKRMYVLIPLTSMEQLTSLDDNLRKDSTYLVSGGEYLNASYEKPPYRRMESVVLRAFEDMPTMQAPMLTGPRSNRVYELRSYESPTESYYWNKVDMFNAGGEVSLFKKLEFNAVFYAEVIAGSKMPNLMYMTTFEDSSSREAHWKAFVEAPEWKELEVMPRYQNNVSHADILFLYPTEYSDY